MIGVVKAVVRHLTTLKRTRQLDVGHIYFDIVLFEIVSTHPMHRGNAVRCALARLEGGKAGTQKGKPKGTKGKAPEQLLGSSSAFLAGVPASPACRMTGVQVRFLP